MSEFHTMIEEQLQVKIRELRAERDDPHTPSDIAHYQISPRLREAQEALRFHQEGAARVVQKSQA